MDAGRRESTVVDRSDVEQSCIEQAALVFRMDPGTLSVDTRFTEDLKIRSMQAFKLTILLENTFDIKLPLSRVLKNQTLGDCAALVAEVLANRADK